MFCRSIWSQRSARILVATLIVALPGLAVAPMAEAEPKEKPLKASTFKRGKKALPETKQVEIKPTGPLVISIALNSQHLTVFDGTTPIATSRISSGKIGHSTPTGVYSILEKNRIHHSNIYSGAPMPNMQRITWSGIALHAGVVPGYPASHGCVRLPSGFSSKLFSMTRVGTRVIISRDLKEPQAVSHKWLAAVSGPEAIVASAEPQAGGERRLSPAERREAELGAIMTDIREAGYALAGLRFGVEHVVREADAKRALLQEKRSEVQQLQAAWRKQDAERQAAKRDLDKFTRTRLARLDTGVANDASPQETEQQTALEERFTVAADAADDAELAFKAAETALEPFEAQYLAAEDARKSVMMAIEAARTKLASAREAEQAFKRREAKRAMPVSVLISRSKGRLYVRQGWEQIMDVPVTFDRPDDLVGTHVFTALEPEAGSKSVRWSVVSIDTPVAKPGSSKRDRDGKKAKPVDVPQAASAPQTVEAALSRVAIPVETREEIADLMKPGSSIIVSDFGLGNETGEYTDFIVQTRQ